ncbi:hypothetical protein FOZ63_032868, partial [Perkinsus olseni]
HHYSQRRYILSQVIDVIIQSLAWLELGGVDVLSVGGRTQVAPPRLLMSHAFLLSIDLLSAPLLYYHGCVKLAVAFDAAIDLGFIWLLSFIMVLMSSWALGLFAVIYTAVTQFGTDCGSSFDPLAWCRWSPNACDCRLVVGQTHTLDEEHGGSNCAALPEVIISPGVLSPAPFARLGE